MPLTLCSTHYAPDATRYYASVWPLFVDPHRGQSSGCTQDHRIWRKGADNMRLHILVATSCAYFCHSIRFNSMHRIHVRVRKSNKRIESPRNIVRCYLDGNCERSMLLLIHCLHDMRTSWGDYWCCFVGMPTITHDDISCDTPKRNSHSRPLASYGSADVEPSMLLAKWYCQPWKIPSESTPSPFSCFNFAEYHAMIKSPVSLEPEVSALL